VTLGFSAVNNVAVASSVVDNLFPKNAVRGFGWKEFWVHSVTCGAAAEVIWSHLGCSKIQSETAFVSGLLHDVGKLIIARAIPGRFLDVVNCCQIQRCDVIDAENAILYTTHAHIGLDLSRQWNFPESLCSGIAFHHHSADNANLPDVARIVKAGNMLAKALAPNYVLDVPFDVDLGEIASIARLDSRRMDSVVHQVELKMAQCEELLAWGDALPETISMFRAA
jgi:HD-like signal output (HDOD) protein